MESGKLVIKHHGIELIRKNKVALVSKTPYIDSSDGCLEELLDSNTVKDSYNAVMIGDEDTSIKESLTKAEKEFSYLERNFELLVKLIEQLRNATSKKDLEKIYQEILIGMKNIEARKAVEEVHTEYPDLILSIMVKAIVNYFIKIQLARGKNSNKIRIYEIRMELNEPIEEIMSDALKIDFTEKAPNGVDTLIAKSFTDQLLEEYLRMGSKCFDCSNGYVGRCEKITDYPSKKDITEYPFITDGFQWYINDDLDEFNIIKCDNFALAPKVTQTLTEFNKTQAAKRLMRLLYWDAATKEEAENIEQNNKALGYH